MISGTVNSLRPFSRTTSRAVFRSVRDMSGLRAGRNSVVGVERFVVSVDLPTFRRGVARFHNGLKPVIILDSTSLRETVEQKANSTGLACRTASSIRRLMRTPGFPSHLFEIENLQKGPSPPGNSFNARHDRRFTCGVKPVTAPDESRMGAM